jgi:hypothetical protein
VKSPITFSGVEAETVAVFRSAAVKIVVTAFFCPPLSFSALFNSSVVLRKEIRLAHTD